MRLKDIRLERGMTQEQVAVALKTDVPQLSRLENYKCLPIPADMDVLTEILNCEIEDLYDTDEITYTKKKKQAPSGEYKVTVRLPADAKDDINAALKTCHYVGGNRLDQSLLPQTHRAGGDHPQGRSEALQVTSSKT